MGRVVGGGDEQLRARRCPRCPGQGQVLQHPLQGDSLLEAGLQCARTFHSARCKCTFQFGIARDM